MLDSWVGSVIVHGGAAEMRKTWYDPNAPSVRTASEVRASRESYRQRRERESSAGLGSCLIYPLRDGPGVALLVVMPPFLFLLSLPVFDWIAIVDPFKRADWRSVFWPCRSSFRF